MASVNGLGSIKSYRLTGTVTRGQVVKADGLAAGGLDGHAPLEGHQPRHVGDARHPLRDFAKHLAREGEHGRGIGLELGDLDAAAERAVHALEILQVAAVIDDGDVHPPAFGLRLGDAAGRDLLRRVDAEHGLLFLGERRSAGDEGGGGCRGEGTDHGVASCCDDGATALPGSRLPVGT